MSFTSDTLQDTLNIYLACNAEAQKKTLQKLTTQKSHSFTAGVKQSESPAADCCPARRFDDLVTGSPAVTPHDAGRMTDELYDSPKLKALQQKLRRQVAEDHVSSPAVSAAPGFSPRINSSFGGRESLHDESAGSDLSPAWEQKPQGQPAGKLVQQVMTHTVHTEARTIQQMSVTDPRARTHIATDSWGSQGSTPADFGAMDLNHHSQTVESHVMAEDVRTINTLGSDSLSQCNTTARREVVTTKVSNTGPGQSMNQALGNRGQSFAICICHSRHFDKFSILLVALL